MGVGLPNERLMLGGGGTAYDEHACYTIEYPWICFEL